MCCCGFTTIYGESEVVRIFFSSIEISCPDININFLNEIVLNWREMPTQDCFEEIKYTLCVRERFSSPFPLVF